MSQQFQPIPGTTPETRAATTHAFVPTVSGLLRCTQCNTDFWPEPSGNYAWPMYPEHAGRCPKQPWLDFTALSVMQPWAQLIVDGHKTIETRTWKTPYRGELLLVSGLKRDELDWLPDDQVYAGRSAHHYQHAPLAKGYALAIVELVDVRPMQRGDEWKALCPYSSAKYSWVLANVRPVQPIAVKGALRLFQASIPAYCL